MSVNFVKGSVLDADVQYICHQVNCQGKMNSGVAKAIREKWPGVFTAYQNYCNYYIPKGGTKSMLGTCQYLDVEVGKKTVINMFAQDGYGYDGRRYTSYDAFWACLGDIVKTVPKGSTIAFPDHIGCGLGGANWEVIKTMIWEALSEDYDVYIYKLEA